MTNARTREISISVKPLTGDFAEDKDVAATLRESKIRKALAEGQRVVLDFKGVRLATQSFIHALVSDVLRTHGESSLGRITFKGCSNAVKGIIETVVQYSLESIELERHPDEEKQSGKEKPRRRKK